MSVRLHIQIFISCSFFGGARVKNFHRITSPQSHQDVTHFSNHWLPRVLTLLITGTVKQGMAKCLASVDVSPSSNVKMSKRVSFSARHFQRAPNSPQRIFPTSKYFSRTILFSTILAKYIAPRSDNYEGASLRPSRPRLVGWLACSVCTRTAKIYISCRKTPFLARHVNSR